MSTLPTLALFAKITPVKIEGTVFAFLTGTTNLAANVISPMIGVWINEKYFNVTAEDLSQYKNLYRTAAVAKWIAENPDEEEKPLKKDDDEKKEKEGEKKEEE